MAPKQPKSKRIGKQKKQPRGVSSETLKEKVQWCFELFDNHEWHGRGHKEKTFLFVANELKQYSKRTWNQILRKKWRDHGIPVDKISPNAQRRLRKLDINVDYLWRFRFSSKLRIWGIKAGKIFRVLWWDPEHEVYPTEPRNT